MCTGIPVPSRNKEILNTVAILAAITYPIVALRYYQRWTIAQQGWLDDWIALITCVSSGHALLNPSTPEIQAFLLLNERLFG